MKAHLADWAKKSGARPQDPTEVTSSGLAGLARPANERCSILREQSTNKRAKPKGLQYQAIVVNLRTEGPRSDPPSFWGTRLLSQVDFLCDSVELLLLMGWQVRSWRENASSSLLP